MEGYIPWFLQDTEGFLEQDDTVKLLPRIPLPMTQSLQPIYQQIVTRIIGRQYPHPSWMNQIPFLDGYQIPSFSIFIGYDCPMIHLLKFMDLCREVIHSNAFLLHQFPLSLDHDELDWYLRIQPGSVLNWNTMVEIFVEEFFSS